MRTPCKLTPGEEGGLVATFPDVPEAITSGENRCEALGMAEDALATALALAGRLGISESAVRKLANPDHRSYISHVQKALRVVGYSLVVDVVSL